MVFFFNGIAHYDTLILNCLSNWKDISIYWFDLCSSKVFFHAFYVHNILKNIYWQRIWITFLTFFFYYFCCRRKALLGCRYFRKMNTRTEMRWKVKPILAVDIFGKWIREQRWDGKWNRYTHLCAYVIVTSRLHDYGSVTSNYISIP